MIDPGIVEKIVFAMSDKDAFTWHHAIHRKIKEPPKR